MTLNATPLNQSSSGELPSALVNVIDSPSPSKPVQGSTHLLAGGLSASYFPTFSRVSSASSIHSRSADEHIASERPKLVSHTTATNLPTSFSTAHFAPSEPYLSPTRLPTIPGYGPLRPIYPFRSHSVCLFRSVHQESNTPVLIKLSARPSLEDLTRIRHEWNFVNPDADDSTGKAELAAVMDVDNQMSKSPVESPRFYPLRYRLIDHVTGILRPRKCLRTADGHVALVYDDASGYQTLRERYISSIAPDVTDSSQQQPAQMSTSPQSAQTSVGVQSPTKRRSKSELIAIIQVVISVLKTLHKIHKRSITHNGLTSSTVFVDNEGRAVIAGWDFSFSLRGEDASHGYLKTHINQIANDLAYVAPEATGFMNRLVDYRADLYSVGCILYELVTGVTPFRSTDPLELAYMQALRPAPSPSLVADWLPTNLCVIVGRLLEKNADDRYQSARCVVSDLELILQQIESEEPSDSLFIPDTSLTSCPAFMAPQLIYGRSAELQVLQSCFKNSDQHGFQFVFVRGEPGSGKSKLILELERLSIAHRKFFLVSKFDQYQRGSPFYSIVTVLKDIVHQIMSGSEYSIRQWRENIISNLGVDFSVLFSPIPELKLLLGRAYLEMLPKNAPLGPVPRELRFKFVVKSLFCLFGRQGLTVFLDDIQWCPYTELSLFRELATFANEKYAHETHITFVCASTLSPTNQQISLEKLAQDLDLHYDELVLSPLEFSAVREIVGNAIGCVPKKKSTASRRRSISKARFNIGPPPANEILPVLDVVDTQAQALSETVYGITNGNPLFVQLILNYLYYEQVIYFDTSLKKENNGTGSWKVDFGALEVTELPTDIPNVVITMVKKLPKRVISILCYAACICSNSFTLEDLAIGADVSFAVAAMALNYALEIQLIIPQTIHYKFPFVDPAGTTNIEVYEDEIRKVAAASTYKFYHDLVQQAVYSLMEEREAQNVHRLIGLRLLGDDKGKIVTHRLLEIASQLKNAVPVVKDEEKSIYIDLNIRAGITVYGMSDFDMAFGYFETARKLLPRNFQSITRSQAKGIFFNLAELEYNRKNYDHCLEIVANVFDEFPDALDQAFILKTKTKALYGLGRTNEAISAGLTALKLIGFDIEEGEEWNKAHNEKLKQRIPLSINEIRGFVDLRTANNQYYLLAQEIIAILTIPLILSTRSYLFRSLVYTSVIAFIDHGSSASCSFSLLSLASLFQKDGGSANLTRAYEYSKLAIVTLECDTAVGLDFGINIYEYYALTLAIFFEPLAEVTRYYSIVLSSGQTFEDHCGMLSLSYDFRPLCRFLAGDPLDSVLEMFMNIKPVALQSGDDSGRLWIQVHKQGLNNLICGGDTDDPCNLEGKYLDGALGQVTISESGELIYTYYILKLVNAVIYGNRTIAASIISGSLPNLMRVVPVTMYHTLVAFYGALAMIDSDNRSEEDQDMLNRFFQDLGDWQNSCPSMFLHKYLLIKAEIGKPTANSIATLDTYETAIAAAVSERFIQEAAIIHERCANFLVDHSRTRAIVHYKEACRLYDLWGAKYKVSLLVAEHPELTNLTFDVPKLTLSSNELGTTGGNLISDLRQRQQSLGSARNLIVQNASPLRWILSNLFRDEMGEISATNEVSSENVNNSANENGSSHENSENSQDIELKGALQACLEISESFKMESVISKLVESVMKTSGAGYCVFVSTDEAGDLFIEAVGSGVSTVTIVDHEPLGTRTDVAPTSVIQQVISSCSFVYRNNDVKRFDELYGRDSYFQLRRSQSVLAMPIHNNLKVVGALYLEHETATNIFSVARIELIGLLCTQAAVSVEKAKLYHEMDLAKKTAEEATAEKASFLANMSHEIRTPFNALLSCAIFLLDTDLSEMQQEYVETIRSSAVLTLNIIDAILAFSKIEHGSITLDNSPFSLRECVESALQLVAEPAATKDLELVHLNRCGETDIVYGDVTRVRQIIINLVGNAVKFTSKGHIVVETTAEQVLGDNMYEFVISVSDTGIGIPRSARGKIFRAFSQVDGSSRRIYGGSGLGLAISKKLAELMGGDLSFVSEENKGSKFWFSIVAMVEKPKNASTIAYKGKRCLVADSHETAKESLLTELTRLGFEVDQCCNAEEAMKLCLDKPPTYYSLIFIYGKLLDGSNGKESKAIKRHSKCSQIVYMTIFGSAIPDDAEEKGIAAILLRPVQRSKLVQIIQKIMTSDSLRSMLPAKRPDSQSAFSSGMIESLATRHPLKILLAEDNKINTRVALQHLKRMGYNADHAKDGVEVIEKCAQEVRERRPMYDCILMDIQMPNKDGIAAAQELADIYDASVRPSVIALTANAAGDDRAKCLEMGMVNYLVKPILPMDLAAVLMGVKPLKVEKVESKVELNPVLAAADG